MGFSTRASRLIGQNFDERRHSYRFAYYFDSGTSLISDPGYVGALQTTLRRLGYYCGPIDGVFSVGVQDAIARMQRTTLLRVTGTLTLGVRREQYVPRCASFSYVLLCMVFWLIAGLRVLPARRSL